jgi:hypothetical protein
MDVVEIIVDNVFYCPGKSFENIQILGNGKSFDFQ